MTTSTTYEYGLETVQEGDEVLAVFKVSSSRTYGVTEYEIGTVTKLNKKTFWVKFGDQRVMLTYHGSPRTANRFSKYHKAAYLPATSHNRELVERQRLEREQRVETQKRVNDAKQTFDRIRHLERGAVLLRNGWRPSDLALTTLPDGSRLWSGSMPVNPAYAEQKVFEQVFIRCKNVEDLNWKTGDKEIKVEAGYAYITARTHSFSSVSTSRYDNDYDAIMDAIIRQYYSW